MLLSFNYDEIYFKSEPLLVGKTFHEVLFLYRTCSVIGLMFADETIKICPSSNTIIQQNDQIIVIAEDDDAINLSIKYQSIPALFQTDSSLITNNKEKQTNIEKNIILGWNSKATLIAKQLDNYVSEDSELHILTNKHCSEVT
jgi:NhaP-type Na+/H+ and K+/H+ antiporter